MARCKGRNPARCLGVGRVRHFKSTRLMATCGVHRVAAPCPVEVIRGGLELAVDAPGDRTPVSSVPWARMGNEATNMDVRWRREARSKVRALLRWRAWALVTLVAVIGIVSTGAHNSGPAAASHSPTRRIAASLELPAHFTRAARLTLDDLANRYIARMTLDEKLGQLFLADLTGDSYDASTAAMVQQMHSGGIILHARSIVTTAQTRVLVNAAQVHATLPLFVATDEQGGYVDRMQSIYGFRPAASQIGATASRAFAFNEGARVGRDMHSIGLNFDFGPDIDVQLVDGPHQSPRTYGSTPAAGALLRR